MTMITTTKIHRQTKQNYKWPTVIALSLYTAIPSLPAIVILVLLSISLFTGSASHEFINILHFKEPLAVFLHGGAGILFFLTMPTQYSPALRYNYPWLHRACGLTTISSAIVMATSAIWIHQIFHPDSSYTKTGGVIISNLGIICGFILGLNALFKQEIVKHRRWVNRAVACTLAPITILLVEIPIIAIFGSLNNLQSNLGQWHYDYGLYLGLLINLTFVEYKAISISSGKHSD